MFLDIVILLIFGSVIGIALHRLITLIYIRKRAIEAMPDDEPVMDEVQEEDYNGNELYIKEENRDIWNKLTRKQKRWVMNEQKKKLKSGQYVKVEGGIITRAEAKKRGLI